MKRYSKFIKKNIELSIFIIALIIVSLMFVYFHIDDLKEISQKSINKQKDAYRPSYIQIKNNFLKIFAKAQLLKPESDFETLIRNKDNLSYSADYEIVLRGDYKDSSIETRDGGLTIWKFIDSKDLDIKNIDVTGLYWPDWFIRYEGERWVYDLQEVVENNPQNFEITFSENKKFLNEITSCFLIKGKIDNEIIDIEQCYDYFGIMLYQNISLKQGGMELIANSYKFSVD